MRVCHFSSGAVDTAYFRNIAMGLAERGHTVVLSTLGRHLAPNWVNAAAGVQYSSLGINRRTLYPLAVARLALQLRMNRCDVCHAHLFDGGLVGIAAARLARIPVGVLGRHHHDHHQMKGRPAHVRVDHLSARLAHCTVAPSHAVSDHMKTVEGLESTRIEVIHYGFDYSEIARAASRSAAVRRAHGMESAFIIGFTGRLVPDKGLAYLLEATRLLVNEIPGLRLILVGDAGSSWLHSAIRDHDLSERVLLTGFRRDAPRYMASMDLAVHPSLSDSFPQALIEAMAVGTPVIATNVGGIPEIVSHNLTGVLVPPGDASPLARAILDLYRDPQRRQMLGKAGMKTVRQRFTLDAMITQQLRLYEALLR